MISNSKTNGGLGSYYLKAQEFETLSEVLYRHAQNTYNQMVNTDKVLATSIANFLLEEPTTSAEDKEAIRKDTKGSVEQIMRNRQADAKESGAQ